MTLTEEQRGAIKYAISSLEQCGSEPEDPVVVKILLAMIDSSEHVIEPTKMIGFDPEKARADLVTANKPTYDYLEATARVIKIHMPGAIDEIERLRALRSDIITTINRPKTTSDKGLLLYIRDEVDYNIRQAAQIGDLEAEIEMLQADAEQYERVIEARSEVINQQAARIKELEDALVEELARGDYFDESQECEGYWWDRKNTSDCTQNDYRRNARLKLQADGKIGPSAAKTIDQTRISAENPQKPGPNHQKPAIWQITEERIEALEYMCEWHFCTDKLQFCGKYPEYILQAMLTEAE
jgi:hypothetical protein